jgi:ferredoxin-NADP reductase
MILYLTFRLERRIINTFNGGRNMKLRLISVTNREGDIKEFAFKPAEPLSWQAGQYMHYVLPQDTVDDRGIERWFTNSAAPSEGEVRITTRINHDRSSSFKTALQALQPGDEIEADGPEGDFTLEDLSRNYLFIVGGIGVTPVRSMLVEAHSKGLKPNATLLYANRSVESVPFRSELEGLQADNPNFKIVYVIDPDRLDETKLRTAIDAIDDPYVYISGPETMVKALAEQVKSLGITEDNLKIDDFPGYEGI